MDVITAAFHVVHDAEGGVPAVAQFLGKARNTLDHELKPPRQSSFKLGLVDAVKITKRFSDFRILYAMAEECEHICIPAPPAPSEANPSTGKVLSHAAKLAEEMATSFKEINQDLSDDEISANELARYEAQAINVIAAVADVVRAMRAKMEGDLAAHQAQVEASRGPR